MSVQTITKTETVTKTQQVPTPQEWKLVWRNIIMYILMHVSAFYAVYLCIVSAQWKTIFYSYFVLILAMIGMGAGSHRLWAHKTYKATLPLRAVLIILQTLALQRDVYYWATCHRVHHKYVDTDADPHDSRRGFFFSHMGWLFIEEKKEVTEKFQCIEASDLQADKLVMFQKKYYWTFFVPVIGVLIPSVIPWYYWGDTLENGFFIATMMRFCLSIHYTFATNSWAHLFGTRPYDKTINPREVPIVSFLNGGEAWHNYHHAFPWDYKTGELGNYRANFTTGFLDLMAAIGWAYDLKSASHEMIMKRVKRTGDGTRKVDKLLKGVIDGDHHHGDDQIWGWGDKDMTQDEMSMVDVSNRKED